MESIVQSFAFAAILLVAIIVGFMSNGWIGLFIFSGGCLLVGRAVHQNRETQYAKAKNIIEAHANELSIRRSQLTANRPYGLVDDSKWVTEVITFVSRVLEPKVGSIDVLGKNRDRVLAYINLVTENFRSSRVGFNNDITPLMYEKMVADALTDYGWKTRLTVATGDQGIDIVAEKLGIKVVIQCKLYSTPVGNGAVQEALAGKAFEGAAYAVVVSNAMFTRSAQQLATSSGVLFLHHEELLKLDDVVKASI